MDNIEYYLESFAKGMWKYVFGGYTKYDNALRAAEEINLKHFRICKKTSEVVQEYKTVIQPVLPTGTARVTDAPRSAEDLHD